MYFPQRQLANLKEAVTPGKVVVIYGPRRVGKTTLLKKYLESIPEEGGADSAGTCARKSSRINAITSMITAFATP